MANNFFDKLFGMAKEVAETAEDRFEGLKEMIEGGVEGGRNWAAATWRNFMAKEVTVYPTYAYRDPKDSETWVAPVRVWVRDNIDAPFIEDWIRNKAISHFEEDLRRPLNDDEKERLRECLIDFVTDDKSNERVEFTFGDDREGRLFTATHHTDVNGLIEETLRLPDSVARQLLDGTGARWLSLNAVTNGGEGRGRVRLLAPEGVSVISDIDDTIKVTQVPAGKKTVLRNTFLRPYKAAPTMLEMYRGFGAEGEPPDDLSFHYVSGSPWQMFRLLHKFLVEETGFPPGTFHMKNLRKNLTDMQSLQDIKAFALGGDLATLDQKIRQITNLMVNLPRRQFILVGDSGERDPEVYRAISELFPTRVREIHIRDVLNERLRGMRLITGPEVGVSLDTSEIVGEMKKVIGQTEDALRRDDDAAEL